MPKVVIHIGRLVLRGIASEHRDAVVDGLREELARAFTRREFAARWASSGQRDSIRDRMPYIAEPGALGGEAARRIAKTGQT